MEDKSVAWLAGWYTHQDGLSGKNPYNAATQYSAQLDWSRGWLARHSAREYGLTLEYDYYKETY